MSKIRMALVLIFLNVFSFVLMVFGGCRNKEEKYLSGRNKDLSAALQFLQEHDRIYEKMVNKQMTASWNYSSNLTEYNKKESQKVDQEMADFREANWKKATSFAWKDFKDTNETAYKWFKILSVLGSSALSKEKFTELSDVTMNMEAIYAKAKVCSYKSNTSTTCTLSLEPDLVEILKKSTNYDELRYIWSSWRDKTGKKIKKYFLKYVELSNEAACLNGFSDNSELWLEQYGDNFKDEANDTWNVIKPFYQQLHAYVRRKLINIYSDDHIKPNGPIPAHLLGNMWAQNWENIYDLVLPYPNKKSIDVTATMKKKNMRALDMFKIAEEVFTSLGLIKMPAEFWDRSIIEKPTNRDMVCHASAYDFYDKKDFRIKMCTRVDMEHLITVHHEMGHVEYYLQYKHQPVVYREGANSGFHEAVGDVMALSVATPEHLKKIGLLDEVSDDKESDLNSLMKVALHKIAFIPFGFLVDNWRWKVFDGSINNNELNTQWWKLRLQYQGLCPPLLRTEEDFDPGAKYHIVANIPYLRYFVSFVIQFQFHKALCDEAGFIGPLHKCDIYQNKKAGKLLSDTLRLGSSVSWRDAMKVITKGKTDKIDPAALLEYFKPLYDWLKEQNKDEVIGWHSDNPMICS